MVRAGEGRTTGGMTAAKRLPSGSCACKTGFSSSSVFRGGLLGAIQFQNRVHPDFPDGLLRAGLLAVVLPAAQLAFHHQVSALLERASELRELAEDDATVPFGVRDVLAVFLVGALGCQRESGEDAVVVGANFCVVAEEADEV